MSCGYHERGNLLSWWSSHQDLFNMLNFTRAHYKRAKLAMLDMSTATNLCGDSEGLQNIQLVWVHLCRSLSRSVSCCTILWANAALLKSPLRRQFAPSRQSVLSPQCTLLLSVSGITASLLMCVSNTWWTIVKFLTVSARLITATVMTSPRSCSEGCWLRGGHSSSLKED